MVIGYARVSTDEQTNAVQLSALKKAGCVRIYQEKESGSNNDRPELAKCLDRLEKGDKLMVWRLDRLGRSLRHLLETVTALKTRGVTFVSLTEHFDTGTASGRLIFHVFASLTEFERELIRERTKFGLEAARARGRLGGRKRLLTDKQMTEIREMWDANQLSKEQIGKIYGVSKATIDRVVRPVRIGPARPVAAAGTQKAAERGKERKSGKS